MRWLGRVRHLADSETGMWRSLTKRGHPRGPVHGTDAVASQRVIYNVIGIAIGLLVVLYAFPAVMRRLRAGLSDGQP